MSKLSPPSRHSRVPVIQQWAGVLALASLVVSFPAMAEPGDRAEFRTQSEFVAKLAAPMTIVVDSAPFRVSLDRVAKTAGVNLWLDRTVDPTADVSPGSVGPSVYECFASIAACQDCVVAAADGVVLVGSQSRVDAVLLTLMSRPVTATEPSVLVGWEDLSTPQEALRQALGPNHDLANHILLAHDLWPATTWSHITRSTAVSLVLAQMNMMLSDDGRSIRPIESDVVSIDFPYQHPGDLAPLRDATRLADSRARFRTGPNGAAFVTATPAGHRALRDAIIRSIGSTPTVKQKGGVRERLQGDRRQFSLKLLNKPAKDVMNFLAQTAGVSLAIDASAEDAVVRLISLEVTDATLMDLIYTVAKLAKVRVVWADDEIRLTL